MPTTSLGPRSSAAATEPRAQSGVRIRKSGGSALAPMRTETRLLWSSETAAAETRASAETSARNAAPSEGLRSATRLTATATFFPEPPPSSLSSFPWAESGDSSAALTVEFGPWEISLTISIADWGTASGGAAELPMEAACFLVKVERGLRWRLVLARLPLSLSLSPLPHRNSKTRARN